MSFGQRFHIELFIVTLVIGILISIFLDYSRIYLRIVSLVEPSFYAQNLKVDMASYFAQTGRWPQNRQLPDDSLEQFTGSVRFAEVDASGDIKIGIKSRFEDLDGKALTFVLNQYVSDQGYVFNSWRCGGAESPSPYKRSHINETEIPRLITDTLCRRK